MLLRVRERFKSKRIEVEHSLMQKVQQKVDLNPEAITLVSSVRWSKLSRIFKAGNPLDETRSWKQGNSLDQLVAGGQKSSFLLRSYMPHQQPATCIQDIKSWCIGTNLQTLTIEMSIPFIQTLSLNTREPYCSLHVVTISTNKQTSQCKVGSDVSSSTH